MKNLLIIACSATKRPDPHPMPAIDRYDGPMYWVLRKAKKEGRWPDQLEILILSAKHGLIEADKPIDFYDCKMTPTRAKKLRPSVSKKLNAKLARGEYRVWVNLGQIYLLALPPLPPGTYYAGRLFMGQRCAQLKEWLDQMMGAQDEQRE